MQKEFQEMDSSCHAFLNNFNIELINSVKFPIAGQAWPSCLAWGFRPWRMNKCCRPNMTEQMASDCPHQESRFFTWVSGGRAGSQPVERLTKEMCW
jgi:hypothetical protein